MSKYDEEICWLIQNYYGYNVCVPLYYKINYLTKKVEIFLVGIDTKNSKLGILKTNKMSLTAIPNLEFSFSQISFNKITGYELIQDSQVISRNIKKFGSMLVGGLLFGGLGAIAGSINANDSQTKQTQYMVRLIIDDIHLGSVDLKCESAEKAYRLLNTLKIVEERYVLDNYTKIEFEDSDQTKINNSIDQPTKDIDYSDQIIKIKELLDEGTIDKEQFNKLVDNLIKKSK